MAITSPRIIYLFSSATAAVITFLLFTTHLGNSLKVYANIVLLLIDIWITNISFSSVSFQSSVLTTTKSSFFNTDDDGPVTWWAVFSASTPDGVTRRSFDYAFYLPLTAMAWERVGFRSLVIIAGLRCEWERDPALKLILDRLEIDRKVHFSFNYLMEIFLNFTI